VCAACCAASLCCGRLVNCCLNDRCKISSLYCRVHFALANVVLLNICAFHLRCLYCTLTLTLYTVDAHTATTATCPIQQCNYPYADGDVHWDSRNAVLYPCLCFFAGVFAGLFGIGGGIVKGISIT
jgi:uncharacterized membrane protein YfcA